MSARRRWSVLVALAAVIVAAPLVSWLTDTAFATLTQGFVQSHTHASAQQGGTLSGVTLGGTTTVSGTLTSTKACASGYNRIGPNYCQRSTSFAPSNPAESVTCTNPSIGEGVPSSALAAFIGIRWRALSNNAVGQRLNTITFYNTTTCTTGTQAGVSAFNQYEFAATTAGTTIGEKVDHMIVPVLSGGTIAYLNSNAGGAGNADVQAFYVQGYFD